MGATDGSFCVPCNVLNSYSSEEGSTTCLQCNADFPITDISHTSCDAEPCPDGQVPTYAIDEVAASGTFHGCFNCPKGTREDVVRAAGVCSPCSSGTYQDSHGSDSCRACPLELQVSAMPRNSEQDCTCPVNMYAPEWPATSCRDCFACLHLNDEPDQRYFFEIPCTPTQNRESVKRCSTSCTGTEQYISAPCGCEADIQCAGCSLCAAGKYASGGCDKIVDTQCTLCPPGTYTNQQNKLPSCTQCLAGTIASRTGSTQCAVCAKGTYSNDASAQCIACAPGSFASSESSPACTLCEPGTFASVLGAFGCTACPAGTNQSSYGSTSCAPCPAGKQFDFYYSFLYLFIIYFAQAMSSMYAF